MLNSSPKIQTLFLEQFTAFEEATFDFCPGINVLIRANATGDLRGMDAKPGVLWATRVLKGVLEEQDNVFYQFGRYVLVSL